MWGFFQDRLRSNRAADLLLYVLFVLCMPVVWAQVPTGVHVGQVEHGAGVIRNPSQSPLPQWSLHAVSEARAWGQVKTGANRLTWKGCARWDQFENPSVESRHGAELSVGLERDLNSQVTTGMEGHMFSGTTFERNLRHREEWRLYEATSWDAQWWLSLQSGHRVGRIFVEKGAWAYQSLNGFDRREFAFGAECSFPIWVRVRGERRLSKVGQQRSHHFADLVVEINHRESQFQTWLLQDGPVVGGHLFRMDAVSNAFQGLSGLSLWAETNAAARIEWRPFNGLEAGLEGAWNRRTDAVRGAYDADELNAAVWLGGSNRNWAGAMRAEVRRSLNPGLSVYSAEGWGNYTYLLTRVRGRLERQLKSGLAVFAQGAWQRWSSNGTSLGWYQRGDWAQWQVRLGLKWQRSNEPRWIQDHAMRMRIPLP